MARTKIDVSLITPLSAPLAFGGNKGTGLAAGTTAGDAIRFEQLNYLQAVQGTSTTTTTITSSTFTAATNQTVTITPTSASNRIKITVSTVYGFGSNITGYVTIKRGATELSGVSDGFWRETGALAGGQDVPVQFTYIDSPATTSATTYQVFFRNSNNSTTTLCGSTNLRSTIIAEEIV